MAYVRDLSGNSPSVDADTNVSYAKNIGPSEKSLAYTPSDTAFIQDSAGVRRMCRIISATGAGNITYIGRDGSSNVASLAAGSLVPVFARKIMATGTTATGITVYF